MKNILIIGLKEFRDRLRSGWIVACMFVWLAVISLTSIFGLIQIGHIGVQGYERTTMSLLNLVQYLVPLLGLLVGHDLIVREREDRTLNLVLASGVFRRDLLLGKFLGGTLTIAVPLLIGFAVAGTMIGVAARDTAFTPFLKLSVSGLLLGIAFTAIGLLLSALARTRIQALVCALLAWGFAVFAFDLAALGVIVSSRAVEAAQEIDLLCDASHVNNQADVHAAFDTRTSQKARPKSADHTFLWLWINPVDVFRALNLPANLAVQVPSSAAVISIGAWLAVSLGAATWKLKRIDL